MQRNEEEKICLPRSLFEQRNFAKCRLLFAAVFISSNVNLALSDLFGPFIIFVSYPMMLVNIVAIKRTYRV